MCATLVHDQRTCIQSDRGDDFGMYPSAAACAPTAAANGCHTIAHASPGQAGESLHCFCCLDPDAGVYDPRSAIYDVDDCNVTALKPPPPVRPPPPSEQPGRCTDDPTYNDAGLGCADWLGFNCSDAHFPGFDAASIEQLTRACPVACADVTLPASCAPPAPPTDRAALHAAPETESLTSATDEASYTDEHNERRALHCATPALVRDAELEAAAQAFVDTCPTEHAARASRHGAGENMYWRGGAHIGSAADNLARAVESWYDEVRTYNFATGRSDTGGVVGHFTQVVWRGTQRLGCAVNLRCRNKFGDAINNSVVVCRYQSPGNYAGQYLDHVMRTRASGACASPTPVVAHDGALVPVQQALDRSELDLRVAAALERAVRASGDS